MTNEDKKIIIDWIGDTSPKGIMEATEITASSAEIQTFIVEVHTLLKAALLTTSLTQEQIDYYDKMHARDRRRLGLSGR